MATKRKQETPNVDAEPNLKKARTESEASTSTGRGKGTTPINFSSARVICHTNNVSLSADTKTSFENIALKALEVVPRDRVVAFGVGEDPTAPKIKCVSTWFHKYLANKGLPREHQRNIFLNVEGFLTQVLRNSCEWVKRNHKKTLRNDYLLLEARNGMIWIQTMSATPCPAE